MSLELDFPVATRCFVPYSRVDTRHVSEAVMVFYNQVILLLSQHLGKYRRLLRIGIFPPIAVSRKACNLYIEATQFLYPHQSQAKSKTLLLQSPVRSGYLPLSIAYPCNAIHSVRTTKQRSQLSYPYQSQLESKTLLLVSISIMQATDLNPTPQPPLLFLCSDIHSMSACPR